MFASVPRQPDHREIEPRVLKFWAVAALTGLPAWAIILAHRGHFETDMGLGMACLIPAFGMPFTLTGWVETRSKMRQCQRLLSLLG